MQAAFLLWFIQHDCSCYIIISFLIMMSVCEALLTDGLWVMTV
jgi:hypothetical protein